MAPAHRGLGLLLLGARGVAAACGQECSAGDGAPAQGASLLQTRAQHTGGSILQVEAANDLTQALTVVPAYTTIKEDGYPSDSCSSEFTEVHGSDAASADACAQAAQRESVLVFALNAHARHPRCYLHRDIVGPCEAGQWEHSTEDTTYILSQACLNSDFGATDIYRDSCASWYADYPSTCSFYDDSDFSASPMCCACGGGEKGSVTPVTPGPTSMLPPATTAAPSAEPTLAPTPEPTTGLPPVVKAAPSAQPTLAPEPTAETAPVSTTQPAIPATTAPTPPVGVPPYATIKLGGYPGASCSSQFTELGGLDAASADACALAAQREGVVVFSLFEHSRTPGCYVYKDISGACPEGQWEQSPTDTTYMLTN